VAFSKKTVAQIINLLKRPAEMQEFLLNLDDPEEIRKFTERKLRNKQYGGVTDKTQG
jgi:hypothetical protein